MCRNIQQEIIFLCEEYGSPLRVQEHSKNDGLDLNGVRITPACAGTLMLIMLGLCQKEDHPCVCRNIIPSRSNGFTSPGSPLRVQEHSSLGSTIVPFNGITPACAGTFVYLGIK